MVQINLPGRARIVETVIAGEVLTRTFYVDAAHAFECAQLWPDLNCCTLGISSYENPGLSEVDFLGIFENVTHLHLMLDQAVDLQPLLSCADTLEHFFCNDDINGLSQPERFPRLRNLSQRCLPKFVTIPKLPAMEKLFLLGLPAKDLMTLPEMPHLRELRLFRPMIENLDGVLRFPLLQAIAIGRAAKLIRADALQGLMKLRELNIDLCRKMPSEILSQLTHLRSLVWVNSAELADLKFVETLPELDFLNIMGSKVRNQDLSPVLSHPKLHKFVADFRANFACSERDFLKLRELKRRP